VLTFKINSGFLSGVFVDILKETVRYFCFFQTKVFAPLLFSTLSAVSVRFRHFFEIALSSFSSLSFPFNQTQFVMLVPFAQNFVTTKQLRILWGRFPLSELSLSCSSLLPSIPCKFCAAGFALPTWVWNVILWGRFPLTEVSLSCSSVLLKISSRQKVANSLRQVSLKRTQLVMFVTFALNSVTIKTLRIWRYVFWGLKVANSVKQICSKFRHDKKLRILCSRICSTDLSSKCNSVRQVSFNRSQFVLLVSFAQNFVTTKSCEFFEAGFP